MLSKPIVRAIFKHFDAVRNGLLLHFRPDREEDIDTKTDRIELRVDGPYTRYFKSYTIHDVEVSLLFTVHLTDKKLYTINTMIDTMRLGFVDVNGLRINIPVLDDNSVLIGCLKLTPIVSGDRELKESHFGQIEGKTRVQQASLEGHYRMEI